MKKTYELTETQEGLLRYALSITIEQDETFWVDGLTRDAQTAADYRGLLNFKRCSGVALKSASADANKL